MVCKNCMGQIDEGAKFCPKCGEKVPEVNKNCKQCGAPIEADSKFCQKCGMRTWNPVSDTQQTVTAQKVSTRGDYTGSKTVGAYVVSVISAAISIVIRLALQATHYSYENLLNNRKVVGLDSDAKPFFTIIPVVAAIIVSLLIVSDQDTGTKKKQVAFIVNAVFIALSLLFIWFDIPYQIINF